MIMPIMSHTTKLMTFRHDGKGLYTRSPALLFSLVVASAGFALARWGMPTQAVAHAVIVSVMCFYSVRVGVGYALLSIGIDLTAMAAWFAPKGFFTAWEALALVWLAFRVGKQSVAEK